MNKAVALLIASIVAATVSGHGTAEEKQKVGATELKQMSAGNAIHNYCQRTREISRTYFDPSRTYTRLSQGAMSEGPFYIKDDGSHCNVVEGKDNCDGIYRVGNGTRGGIWEKIAPGKDL